MGLTGNIRNREENGDTLIEVLIAVVIIGLVVVAILGALTTTISSSGEHRSLAADETLINTMAEQVKNAVELQNNPNWPGGSSGDCPSGGLTAWYRTVSTTHVPLPPSLQGSGSSYPVTLTNSPYKGYTVDIANASYLPQYWNGSGWTSSCPSSATGIQKVTVVVTAPTHVTDRLDVIVRKQSDGSA